MDGSRTENLHNGAPRVRPVQPSRTPFGARELVRAYIVAVAAPRLTQLVVDSSYPSTQAAGFAGRAVLFWGGPHLGSRGRGTFGSSPPAGSPPRT